MAGQQQVVEKERLLESLRGAKIARAEMPQGTKEKLMNNMCIDFVGMCASAFKEQGKRAALKGSEMDRLFG